MNTFNSNFYQPDTTATRTQAEKRLIELGYSNFTFKSQSKTNGASFYFEGENGEEIRVSDHPLTGRRAFNTVQVDLYEIKTMTVKKGSDDLDFKARLEAQMKKLGHK